MSSLGTNIKFNKIYQLIYLIICLNLTSCGGGGGGGGGTASQPASIELSSFTPPQGYSGNGTSSNPYIITISNSSDAKISITYKNSSSISSNFYVITPSFTDDENSYTVDTNSTTCGINSSASSSLPPNGTCNYVISPSSIGNNQNLPLPHISSNGHDSQPTINGSTSFFVNFGTTFTVYLGAVNLNKSNLLYQCNSSCSIISGVSSNSGNGVFVTNNSLDTLFIGIDSSVYYLNEVNSTVVIANNITSISGDSIQSITANESQVIVGTKAGIISQCSQESCTRLANLNNSNFESLTQVAKVNGTIYALGQSKTLGNSVIYSNSNDWSSPILDLSNSSYGIVSTMEIKTSSAFYLGGYLNSGTDHSGIIYNWNGSSTPTVFDSHLGGGDVKAMQLTENKSSLYVTTASNSYKCSTSMQTTDCPIQYSTSFIGISSTAFNDDVYFGGLLGVVYSSIIGWEYPLIKINDLSQAGKITSIAIH